MERISLDRGDHSKAHSSQVNQDPRSFRKLRDSEGIAKGRARYMQKGECTRTEEQNCAVKKCLDGTIFEKKNMSTREVVPFGG